MGSWVFFEGSEKLLFAQFLHFSNAEHSIRAPLMVIRHGKLRDWPIVPQSANQRIDAAKSDAHPDGWQA